MKRAPAIVSPRPQKTVAFSELSPEQKAAFRTPSGFARMFLKMNLTPKQEKAVDAFLPHRAHVSALFSNETGKTTRVMVAITLWHITVFPRRGDGGGVTATSGSWAQIKNQFMPAVRAHATKFPRSWEFLDTEIKRDGIENFMAYSCTQAGRAEGFHGSADTPLMMLFDECKSIGDDIIRAGEDRCRPQRMGLLSSPGYAMGKFHASQTNEASYWDCHKITVDDCPWIDRVEMKRVIERAGGGDYDRGLFDPFIRSAYFAEFMPFVEGGIFTLSGIEECLADPPQRKPGDRHVRLDFAAGKDENTIAIRHGNRVWLPDAWREKNTMAACGRFVKNLEDLKKEIGLLPHEVEGDADGLGRPFVDRIRELGWPILDYRANSNAFDPTKYRNRESENWFEGAEKIAARQVIIPDDADLKGQLCDRMSKASSDGTRWIESKKDLFARQSKEKRPKRSPDRAEAILGAMARLPRLEGFNLGGNSGEERSPWHDDPDIGPTLVEHEGSIPEDVLRGFDAGG